MQSQNFEQSTQTDNLTRVKPQEGKIEQPASQRSTMQSVSMGEVPNYGQEENILGSVASIHDQMQPENLSGEEKTASNDQGFNAQEIKQAIITEAKAIGENISNFAHQAVEFVQELGHKIFGGAPRVQAQLMKKPYLVKRSAARKLGKKGEQLQKQAGMAAGFSKVYIRQQAKNLRRKANRYYREFYNDAQFSTKYAKAQGEGLKNQAQAQGEQLTRKAKKFQREFAKDGSMLGAQLRAGAEDLRRKGRSLYRELYRSFQAQPTQKKPTGKNDFLVSFSASEWNGNQGKPRTQQFGGRTSTQPLESKPQAWRMEISAHDWNETAGSTARGQAYFLLRKAQDYIYRASKQSTGYQRRLMRQNRRLRRQAAGYGSNIKSQVNQWVDQASKKLGDSSSLRENFDEAKDAAQRKLIEKKADLQYQAELLTKDKFPSKEALQKKEAINSEIRNLHGKENLPQ